MKSRQKEHRTIYDVAAAAGVSIATVSRVLNTPERVNDETRQKVLGAIDRLNYVPKAEARSRALQSIRRIGVLTPFFTAPSFVTRSPQREAPLRSPPSSRNPSSLRRPLLLRRPHPQMRVPIPERAPLPRG
ncbi:MAG: LacI family transcriptional regulator, partial [Chloroflexi bacterium]|nr:LacI family transcriptional regulator [Chloroflexota bacterium]